MSKLSKKLLAILLMVSIILSLASCAKEDPEPSTPHNSVPVGEQIFDADNDVPFIYHEWDPYAYGEFYRDTLGEQVQMDYLSLIEAIMAGNEQIEISSEFHEHMFDMLLTLFPPFDFVVENVNYKDGLLSIEYYDDREQVLSEFKARVEDILNSCICEGDTDIMKAIALYNYLTPRLTYDYAAVGNRDADVSGYRGIMEYEGICQSFASAYSYLCLQLGIDATVVIAFSEDIETHEWSMIKLDGEYYYVDPTFDTGMSSMMYFGFSKSYRAEKDKYPIEWQDVGAMKIYRGDTFEGVDSSRFDELRVMNYDVTIRRINGTMIITGKSSIDNKEYSITIDNSF